MLRRISLLLGVLAIGLGAVVTDRAPVQADVLTTTPRRVLDTRDGTGAPRGQLRPGTVLRLQLDGVAASGETAVLLNVTATRAQRRTFVTAWDCDDPQPATSVLNVEPRRPSANALVLPYSDAGVCFSSSAPVDLIADLTGVTTDGELHVGPSHRAYDSRDGAQHQAGRAYRIPIAGQPGIPGTAALALVNVTVTRAAADGWAIVQACGANSTASTVNFRAAEAVPHFTLSALGGRDICVTASTRVDVIVDTFGWADSSSRARAVTPQRLLDTRSGIGGVQGEVHDGDTIRLRVAGRAGIPNDASGAVVNVVAIRGSAIGFVSVFPCDGGSTSTSTINLWPGVRRANQAILTLPRSGELCVSTSIDDRSGVHLIVDSAGYLDGNVSRPQPPVTSPPTTPPPTITPTTSPTTNPPSSGRFETLPTGAALPSGAECAARVRPAAEIRPENAAPNANRGSRANANTRTDWAEFSRVDGDFTGTTDEIIQWAACKWGIDEDIARAQVIKESYWYMSTNGDNGESWGLGQVRDTAHQSAFQYGSVNARNSSAYNLDYTYASWRACYEGVYTWLNNTSERTGTYGPGDAWGCVGVWFSGRWYWNNDAYLNQSGDSVRWHYENRTWETSGFVNG